MRYLTDFLFAFPSFLEGLARIFDLGGTLQEYNNDPGKDFIALDVQAIGEDMRFILGEQSWNNKPPMK